MAFSVILLVFLGIFSPNFSARSEVKENPVISEIKKMDLMNLTPLQALEKLHDIQQKLL